MVLDLVGLQICIPELIWTVICFFLLLFLLNRFLYKPIFKVMDERNAKINAGLDEGRKAAEAMAENDARLASELSMSGVKARELISEARTEAEKAKSQMLGDAHSQVEDIRRDISERLTGEEAEAVSSIEAQLPDMAELLSERLLGGGN